MTPSVPTSTYRLQIQRDQPLSEAAGLLDYLAALAQAGWKIKQWPGLNHYFGGVTAVGQAGAAGDPRRAGVGLTL